MPVIENKSKWISLEPDLAKRLKKIAAKEGLPLEQLVLSLIGESLAARLLRLEP